MILNNLKTLEQKMTQEDINRVTFSSFVKGKKFKCIYLRDFEPKRLFFTSLGSDAFVLERDVGDDFTISASIENEVYKQLASYISPTYTEERFIPSAFFSEFNDQLKDVEIIKTTAAEDLSLISKVTSIEESDKIYFKTFYRNSLPNKPSQLNIQKTAFAFGNAFSKVLQLAGISTVWSVTPTDKSVRTDEIALLFREYHENNQ
ncbi:DUF6037 family protein [Erysipelothrix tonsillarum]|uniref:DUF6037 family protein n=1 Tax=Erysipelothrix tonsillarum TaxID=38402 RepID=UPI0003717389|nr:DUF6037 family protein [Erysipelothrix tonsillarum]